MADIDTTRPEGRDPAVPAGRIDTDHRLPESTGAPPPGTIAEVDDPELARLQIEQTRARMSDTIEQIEDTLLRKKERIEDRMDVLGPARRTARENPLPMVGGVFLAGLLLGWLTGGDDDEDEAARPAVRRFAPDFDRERSYVDHWEERARTWERRARRLMEVANRQEAELMQARGESVPIRRRRRGGLLRGRGGKHDPGTSRRGASAFRRTEGLDGMPLPPDERPFRPESGGGPDSGHLPAPI
jgi:hypothetical protein